MKSGTINDIKVSGGYCGEEIYIYIMAQLTLIGLMAVVAFDTASNISIMRTDIFRLAMTENAGDYISVIVASLVISLCSIPYLGLLVSIIYFFVKYKHPSLAANAVATEPTN